VMEFLDMDLKKFMDVRNNKKDPISLELTKVCARHFHTTLAHHPAQYRPDYRNSRISSTWAFCTATHIGFCIVT